MIPPMIRYMKPSDLPIIAQLESELFTSASWSLSALAQELNGPDRAYYVCVGHLPSQSQLTENTVQDEILGYAGLWYGNTDAEVMTIGVRPQCQHFGLGRLLLNQLIETAKEKQCTRVLLEVRVDNKPAKHLYKTAGFECIGIRKHYYQPEDIDALTMCLYLESVCHE